MSQKTLRELEILISCCTGVVQCSLTDTVQTPRSILRQKNTQNLDVATLCSSMCECTTVYRISNVHKIRENFQDVIRTRKKGKFLHSLDITLTTCTFHFRKPHGLASHQITVSPKELQLSCCGFGHSKPFSKHNHSKLSLHKNDESAFLQVSHSNPSRASPKTNLTMR